MIVGSEKTIEKVTSSSVNELQSSAKYQASSECDDQVQGELGMAFATPRIEMNEATEESVIIVHLSIHGSATVIGIAIVRSSFATLVIDLVHHELTNLMLKLMLCNTR